MDLPQVNNRDNWKFYDNMPFGSFSEYSKLLGLEDAPELDIADDWETANRILEIGAGEGRVIDGLINRGYSDEIVALERSPNLFSRLKNKYCNQRSVSFVNGSVLNEDCLSFADIGLWLWAGILEFSPREQEEAIYKISQHVKKLVIETPVIGEINATVQRRNLGFLDAGWKERIYYYLPSHDELKRYVKNSDFNGFRQIPYTTSKGKKRMIYVLTK